MRFHTHRGVAVAKGHLMTGFHSAAFFRIVSGDPADRRVRIVRPPLPAGGSPFVGLSIKDFLRRVKCSFAIVTNFAGPFPYSSAGRLSTWRASLGRPDR